MALDINRLNYNTYYKTLDENKMYFTVGVTYIAKYAEPKRHLLKQKPIIYVYHFNADGKIDWVTYGKLLDIGPQCGVEYTLMGWTIQKDTDLEEVGLKRTAKEITLSYETLTPATATENDLLNTEISCFSDNPIEYFKNTEQKKKERQKLDGQE